MRLMLLYAPSELVTELLQAGNEVYAINCIIDLPLDGDLARRLNSVQIRARKKLNLTAIQLTRQAVLDFRPDVIHAFNTASLAWATLATTLLSKSCRPKIVSFRGITRIPSRLDLGECITYFHPRVAAHACESDAVCEAMLAGGLPANQCYVVYNCVSKPNYDYSRESILQQWNLPADSIVVGCIATFRPVKGIDLLLEAAQRIDNPKVKFAIIGSGNDPRVSKLSNDSALRDKLHMPGYIDNAADFLPAFDIFVMPSRAEGLCRSLIEAMQHSLPCVVSDAGGMKELVRHQIDGFVVPKERSDLLADALCCLIEDEPRRRAMGASAKDRCQAVCSPKIVTDKILYIYNRVLQAA